MTDAEIRDILVERMGRLERAQTDTNTRLDEVVSVLGGKTNILVALKEGQERLVDRFDTLSSAILRGFT